jgi:hypothetical protein
MGAEELQVRAPAGKFRVVGFALRDGQKYMIGDFDSKEAAEECAKKHGMVGTSTTTAQTWWCAMEVGNDPDRHSYPEQAWPHERRSAEEDVAADEAALGAGEDGGEGEVESFGVDLLNEQWKLPVA